MFLDHHRKHQEKQTRANQAGATAATGREENVGPDVVVTPPTIEEVTAEVNGAGMSQHKRREIFNCTLSIPTTINEESSRGSRTPTPTTERATHPLSCLPEEASGELPSPEPSNGGRKDGSVSSPGGPTADNRQLVHSVTDTDPYITAETGAANGSDYVTVTEDDVTGAQSRDSPAASAAAVIGSQDNQMYGRGPKIVLNHPLQETDGDGSHMMDIQLHDQPPVHTVPTIVCEEIL